MDTALMEPYKALVVAMIAQTISEIRHGRPDVRLSAWRWLLYDAWCAELCEGIGLNREALTEALKRELERV